jgi:drug/metabolite transporter superfamily protein YnfA/uncharacterized protein YukE
MARIVVIPERLEVLALQMRETANTLRDLEGRLGRTLSGLDWEARQQVNVETQLNVARHEAQRLADEADRLSRYLTERANAFRQADAQGAEALGTTMQEYSKTTMSIPIPKPVAVPNPDIVRSHLNLGNLLTDGTQVFEHMEWLTIVPLLYLASQMKMDNLGKIHFFGPQWLKEWSGLSSQLTKIGPENLARHWLNQELKLSFGPLANLQTVLGLIPVMINSYSTYAGHGGAAVASAILVDSVVAIAISKVFQIGGAALGTVLTPIFGPLGPVGGYVIGSIVASYAENWLRQTPFQNALRNTARQGFEWTVQAASTITQTALNAVAQPVR